MHAWHVLLPANNPISVVVLILNHYFAFAGWVIYAYTTHREYESTKPYSDTPYSCQFHFFFIHIIFLTVLKSLATGPCRRTHKEGKSQKHGKKMLVNVNLQYRVAGVKLLMWIHIFWGRCQWEDGWWKLSRFFLFLKPSAACFPALEYIIICMLKSVIISSKSVEIFYFSFLLPNLLFEIVQLHVLWNSVFYILCVFIFQKMIICLKCERVDLGKITVHW